MPQEVLTIEAAEKMRVAYKENMELIERQKTCDHIVVYEEEEITNYADDSFAPDKVMQDLYQASDVSGDEELIEFNYCPLCGKKLEEN